jgi:hypothetical protein
MMKEALKEKFKRVVLEVYPDGRVEVENQDNPGEESAEKEEGDEIQKSSDLAPVVKDSDEPGVIKDENTQEGEAKFLEGMASKMPRPAPMDQNSLNARAKRGMLDKLSTLKKV